MANDEGQDRTEEATPRRREEAREQGNVAFSTDLVSGVLLLAAFVALMSFGPSIGRGLLDIFRQDLSQLLFRELTPELTQMLFLRTFQNALLIFGAFFGILLATGIAINLVQVGFVITTERLEPDFDRLNPANGLKRLFSVAALVRGLIGILKIIALGIVAAIILQGRIGVITTLGQQSLFGVVESSWAIITRLGLMLTFILAVLGVADYIYQKQRFEASIRMTKQELKEEFKREEGDPIIKNRIRQLQRERSRRKMLATVPKATVVITNPTHYAVALEYEPGSNSAPKLTAKGAGLIAKQIQEIARKHSVPVLERPQLARLLYKTVKEGQEIPTNLFQIVAEVIAFVFRLRGLSR